MRGAQEDHRDDPLHRPGGEDERLHHTTPAKIYCLVVHEVTATGCVAGTRRWPKELPAWQLPDHISSSTQQNTSSRKVATTVPTQQTFLRTYSWEATPIAFPVEKVTLVATVEVGRVEKKQEQHAHSCPIYNINQVWEDSSGLVIMQALARADSITIVLGAHQERFIGLTHSSASGQGPCNTMSARTCQMCNNGHSTVFSLEYKAEKNEYEVSFQQCHAYTYMHKQFGDVDRKGMCIKAVKVDQHKTRA